jgi:hypothetical protein
LHIPVNVSPEKNVHEYPIFEGISGSPEHVEYLSLRRSHQKRSAANRAKRRAKNQILADKHASLSWHPLPFASIPEALLDMEIPCRWTCEQYVRGWAARDGVQLGIVLEMDHEKLSVTCKSCSVFAIVFNLQPKLMVWKLKKYSQHPFGCFGLPTPADGALPKHKAKSCKSAYTARQVARIVLHDAAADPNISTQRIHLNVNQMKIFSRSPSGRFFGSVKKETVLLLQASRVVNIASMEGYAALLRACGHTVITSPES